MNESDYTQTLEQEIKMLEGKLQEKKNTLEGADESPRSEKEVFRDVFREHIKEAVEGPPDSHLEQSPDMISPPLVPVQTAPAHDYVANTAPGHDNDHTEQISALVDIALSKGVLNAVKVARELKNPHLLDDFHDALVDEYYDKLVKRRETNE